MSSWKRSSVLATRNDRAPSPAAIVAEESLVMREYNEVLVLKLEERNEKLEKARRGITAANEQLECRVEERTAELHLANQELEAFSQSIAHDLRSPLTAIAGFSYLLVEECRGKVSVRAMDHLRFISEATGRMNDLTSDLLRLSRAHRAEMSLREIDLSALATAVIQDLRAKQPERQIEFVVKRGMIVNADLGLVRIALENLLSNAWKYTGKTQKPRIEFGGRAPGRYAGFLRPRQWRRVRYGRGWQIVWCILPSSFRGRLRWHRDRIEHGSADCCAAWRSHLGKRGRRSGSSILLHPWTGCAIKSTMKRIRILIADDHEIVREGVRALIERQPDWEMCGEAATGREAVVETEKLGPDIIVMDIGMPELNGLDATRQIKRLLPKCEVLIFTANETDEIVKSVFKAGARGVPVEDGGQPTFRAGNRSIK